VPVGTVPQKPVAKSAEKKSTDARKLLRAEGSRTATVAKQAKRAQRLAREQRLGDSGVSLTKRVWSWAAVSSFVLLVALILAAVYSPLLAIERLSVRGEKLVSEKEIKAALKGQIGKPLPQVNDEEIAKALKRFPLIESFSVISAPPNTLIVKVTERTPIAVVWVDGYGYAFFDPAGVRVGRAENRSNLPTLEISGTPGKSPSFKAAIEVLLALPAELLPRISTVTAKSKDDVSFRLRGYAGQKVIWGDPTQAVLKSKVLAALIKNQSKNDRVTYDVSSPQTPVVRY
jgi:cell division protein FtsQ